MTSRQAQQEALAADKAFSDELRRVYGHEAGDARYDSRGVSTPLLADLAATYVAATRAFTDVILNERARVNTVDVSTLQPLRDFLDLPVPSKGDGFPASVAGMFFPIC